MRDLPLRFHYTLVLALRAALGTLRSRPRLERGRFRTDFAPPDSELLSRAKVPASTLAAIWTWNAKDACHSRRLSSNRRGCLRLRNCRIRGGGG